ncbi:hypothetical protein SCBWM1_gp76 [Synechococcus phage S-CBWM1]|uniref:Uncharacterized protein n=1 Tax=Synechococcus phage S-CBWM1 TaxID=2053653 RepID=A0A3G1L3N8_9CAUD|nr:hypothetical protein HOU61_gp121 [Synechococcus phage S-CBWM1]ATW62760.1 hypothetical protein SCBWM1_gp76 [Synechococcus phage S-CBWM1]
MREFQWRREHLQNSIFRLKKKWDHYKRSLSDFELAILDLEKRVTSLDNIVPAMEDYVQREAGKELRALERENAELRSLVKLKKEIDHHGVEIGCTWAFYDFMFNHISQNNKGIRMMLNGAIFSSVIKKLMEGKSSLIVTPMPSAFLNVIAEGREMVSDILAEAKTSLVQEESWNSYAPLLQEWVHKEMIPNTLGYTLEEPELSGYDDMVLWEECPEMRDTYFPEVFDCVDLYRKNKEAIFTELGLPEAEKEVVRMIY